MVKAVAAHCPDPWVVLYVKRWLSAPLQHADGTLQIRDRGTPQGSAISPVLANLFMHYAFDAWMAREYPTVRFERYADDAVVHCVTNRQANRLLVARSRTGWWRSGCGYTRPRPRSCTARTGSGAPIMSTPTSPSWGTRSVPGRRVARTVRRSRRSCPR